ncbi:hypothetical protein DDI74_18315 [Chryseobacterium gleum]|uniref:hypothetical protein n=1 Tax=Chryseobacterium gleum TaxID=250 RepID=UPI00103F5A7A|nr:hypothetical protein [Chryseobacterium gleum]QBJ88078.1 hypothetical protein DDI74_18315 [Chryseobacterium gleum]
MENKISIIGSEELKDLIDTKEYIYINFSDEYSIKINPFFESIDNSEKKTLIQLFFQLTSINIRIDDLLGKLHIIVLKILLDGKKDNIIINSLGFSNDSIIFLKSNFEKILQNFKNKNLIIYKFEVKEPSNFVYRKR